MQKGFSTILGIIIGILVIGSGAYYFVNSNTNETDDVVMDNSKITEVDENDTVDNTQYTNEENDNDIESSNDSVLLQTDKIFQWSNLYVTKYGNDVFLVNTFSFENEYSGTGTYHLDLEDNTITKLDTPYLYKENEKLYGLKHYPLFSTADLTADTTQDDIDNLVSEKLDELSKNLDIEKEHIKTIGMGGIPIIHAIVKTEYNPESKEMILLPIEEAEYPIYDYDNKTFEIGDLKYPTQDFTNLGLINTLNGNPTMLLGIEFNYNLATEILSLTY